MKPWAHSSRFSKQFDAAVGCTPKDAEHYETGVALRLRAEAERRWEYVATVPPHEALGNEFAECEDELTGALLEATANNRTPPIYTDHQVVQSVAPGTLVHPVTLYVDGVGFGRNDSVVAFWAYFTFSRRRHLCAVLRKSEMCACGCRGWRSVSQIWEMLRWSILSLHSGHHPSSRHDGEAWRRSDRNRAPLASEPLAFRSCVLLVKGDWASFAHEMGMASWTDATHPCPFCCATLGDWHDCTRLTPSQPAHARTTPEGYLQAVEACEHQRFITQEMEAELTPALAYDKTQNGARKRALKRAFPHLGLSRGDRVEPSRALPNVGDFRAGVLVTFWRRSAETKARHRFPLFGADTGLSVNNVGIDWLHTLSLGVFQAWLAELFWDLLLANTWGIQGPVSTQCSSGVECLRKELFDWYKAEASADRMHTKVQKLTLSMLGSNDGRKCALHGAETNGVLAFSSALLARHGPVLGHRRMAHVQSCGALQRIIASIRAHELVMPVAARVQFCADATEHLAALKSLGVELKPKHHFLMEMAARPDIPTQELEFSCFPGSCCPRSPSPWGPFPPPPPIHPPAHPLLPPPFPRTVRIFCSFHRPHRFSAPFCSPRLPSQLPCPPSRHPSSFTPSHPLPSLPLNSPSAQTPAVFSPSLHPYSSVSPHLLFPRATPRGWNSNDERA